MAKDFEGKCYVDNGREYVSWETVQDELGITQMELMRLLQIIGWNFMLKTEFDGKYYFSRDYAIGVSESFDRLKAKGQLHRVKWTLPEC